MCSGPVEQFSPMTSTRSASSVVIALAMSVPSSMRPLVSSVTCACTGDAPADLGEQPLEAGDRRLHLEDVLRRLDEQDVDATFDEVLRLRVVVLARAPRR